MRNKFYVFMICVTLLLQGCYRRESPTPDGFVPTEEQMDSISFYTTHHYSQNYNFIVVADSLSLSQKEPKTATAASSVVLALEPLTVYQGDRLVVADIVTLPAEPLPPFFQSFISLLPPPVSLNPPPSTLHPQPSTLHPESSTLTTVWVQVARDEETIGWTRETSLLHAVAPDNLISRFIDFFSDTHLLIMLGIIVVCIALLVVSRLYRHHARIVHFRDVDSFYPTLLTLLVSVSAVIYSSIQLFDPDSWRHYYYHPSLNPFSLPEHLGCFVALVWAIAIVALATFFDVQRRLYTSEAILYFFGLAAVCSVDYVVFSVSTLYYVGYPLLLAYFFFALWRYFRFSRTRYICGNCGKHLHDKGICPYCGADNI